MRPGTLALAMLVSLGQAFAGLEQSVRAAPLVKALDLRVDSAREMAGAAGLFPDPRVEAMVARGSNSAGSSWPKWEGRVAQPLPKAGERRADRERAQAEIFMAEAEPAVMAGNMAADSLLRAKGMLGVSPAAALPGYAAPQAGRVNPVATPAAAVAVAKESGARAMEGMAKASGKPMTAIGISASRERMPMETEDMVGISFMMEIPFNASKSSAAGQRAAVANQNAARADVAASRFRAEAALSRAQRARVWADSARQAIIGRFERWNLRPVADAILAGAAPTDTVTITSPYAGLVMGKSMDETMASLPSLGEEIMADRALLRLVSPDAFMVVVHVPETQARWLREGQKVSIASDDMGELPEVKASISWVSPELNAEIRAREIHLHLVDPKGLLLPGSLISARIEAALAPDLTAADPDRPETWGKFPLVPKSTVLSTGTRHVAWKVSGREEDGRRIAG